MISKMTKYSFILPSDEAKIFLKKIQTLGLVDITRSAKPVDEHSAALLSSIEAYKKASTKLESLDFSKDPDYGKFVVETHADKTVQDALQTFRDTESRLAALQAELAAALKEVEDRRAWGRFDASVLHGLAEYGWKTRFYCINKKKYDSAWATLYPLQEVFDDGNNVWFVTVSDDPDYSLPVDEIPAPEGDLKEAEDRVAEIRAEMITCKSVLLSLKEYGPEMKKAYAQEAADLQRYLSDAGAGKAAEGKLTTFVGFAPVENEAHLSAEFDRMNVLWFKEEAIEEDDPPIQFKGNWFTKMFTVLTDMYGRPAYNEFDPTPFISFFFTLFFGMCMGDAGYGILLVLIGFYLKRSKSEMSEYGPLVITLGVATMLAGTVMHTFFGINTYEAAWVPGFLKKFMITKPIAGMDPQMVISVLIGIVHICVALLMKAIVSVRNNGFLGSLGTLGWTLLIVGGVILAGISFIGVLDSAVTKWIVICLGIVSAIGIFLLNDIRRNPLSNIGTGLWETYNTATGLLGDTLSYIRLYALGLAGGMLGNAFNLLGGIVLGEDPSFFSWPFYILILVFGHALNLAMCCLGAFVHPLRLNFLEFFKNSGYEGTGRAYDPLTLNK
jgi:V/A-type H+-transporting ATPase subunit I